MVEINDSKPAIAWKMRYETHSLGLRNRAPVEIIETFVGPVVSVLLLLSLALHFEGSIHNRYLILSGILFFLGFASVSQQSLSTKKVISSNFFHWGKMAALLLLTGFITGYINKFSGAVIVHWLWLAPLAQVGTYITIRATASNLLKFQGSLSSAVIVGMNKQGLALAKNIGISIYSNVAFKGFFEDRSIERRSNQEIYKVLGKISDLTDYVKRHQVQRIYLSLPMTSQPRIQKILDNLKDTTASIYFVPDMFITDMIQGHSKSVGGVNVISVCDTPFRGFNKALKRTSDIVLSIFILLLVFPIMLLIACMVRLSSPGPVIFKQKRHGLNGAPIVIYKFRSMTVTEDSDVIQQAQKNDMRVTRLGAFLRKTSLDELPQFINVLQGRMSIVGPRPHAIAHNEIYRTLIKGYMIRHKVRPGITGWAQVNGLRGETDVLSKMQARIDFDLDYLRHWSLMLDVLIILKTIRLVLKDNTAY